MTNLPKNEDLMVIYINRIAVIYKKVIYFLLSGQLQQSCYSYFLKQQIAKKDAEKSGI